MTILGVLGEADKLTERERDEVITATHRGGRTIVPDLRRDDPCGHRWLHCVQPAGAGARRGAR